MTAFTTATACERAVDNRIRRRARRAGLTVSKLRNKEARCWLISVAFVGQRSGDGLMTRKEVEQQIAKALGEKA